MERSVPSETFADEYNSPLDMMLTAEEREHVRREGWTYFDRIYGNEDDDEGNPITEEGKMERLDRYPSPDYRYHRWYTPAYEFRRRAQNAPLSPPPTPPHIPQQHSVSQHQSQRTKSNRIQKPRKAQPSATSRKENHRQKKKAPRRPLTRSLDEGYFQEIELDTRPGKVRYWKQREGCPRGWSYYALNYSDYMRRWYDDRPANIVDMYDRPVNPS